MFIQDIIQYGCIWKGCILENGRKTRFALHSGGTWPIAMYPEMFSPQSLVFDISKPDVYSRYNTIGVYMERLYLRK
jgi:hypothetical protein